MAALAIAGCGTPTSTSSTWSTVTGDATADGGDSTVAAADGEDIKQVEIIVYKPDASAETAEADAPLVDAPEPDTAAPDTAAPDTAAPDAADPDAVALDIAAPDTAAPDTADDAVAQPCAVNCNDGDPCTIDLCQGSSCSHSPAPACGPASPCSGSKDCAKGLVCNTASHTCVVCSENADCGSGAWCDQGQCHSAVACKSDTDCKAAKQVCNKSAGVCVACLSSNDCAANEACKNFACLPVKACKSSLDCPQVCDAVQGVCVACATSDDCPAGKFCSNNQCLPDVCSAPGCAGGAAFTCNSDGGGYAAGQSCDDGSPCTNDTCQAGICTWIAAGLGNCDDGNACTSGDSCAGGKCAGTVVNCDDKNPCTADSCDPKQGCQHAAAAGTCDDGDSCTTADTCTAGKCAGTPKVCDDSNECTDDSCKFGVCVFTNNSAPCGSSSTCSVCSGGKCTAGLSKGANMVVGPGFEVRSALPIAGGGYSGAGSVQLDVASGGHGGSDGWLVLVSPSGYPTGSFAYGGPGNDRFDGHLATQGGYLLYGSVAAGTSSAGYLVRTKADGKSLWECVFPDGDQAVEGHRAVAVAKGWVLGGTVYASTLQGWLGGVDANGGKLWSVAVPAMTGVGGLAVWPDGSLAVAGLGSGGNLVVAHVSADGAILGSTAVLAATAIADATLSVAGELVVYGSYTSGGGGLAAFDSGGKSLWSKSFPVADLESLGRVTAGPNGGFVVSATVKTSSGGLDGWLAGLDAGGALAWSHNYGGLSDDPFYGVTNVAGRLYVAGSTKLLSATANAWIFDLNEVGMMGCKCTSDPGCADANACTYEFCNLGLCYSFNNAAGTACGTGGKCDANGVCK